MRANDIQPAEPTRHGAYVCLNIPAAERAAVASAGVTALAESMGLQNEYGASGGDPRQSIAYLRRVSAEPGQIDDRPLLDADVVVHVAAPERGPVEEFQARLAGLLPSAISPRVLAGVVLPLTYTGMAMHNFAYGHRILQQPGTVMPSAFLVPMRKAAAWWEKDWMEQHTYFLPRYDDAGRMHSQGHALAAAAGISCLLRRTYKHPAPPATDGEYDFIGYFECTDDDVPVYRQVRDALRDVARNPEWQYVSEGPTWHGRRVASWTELFAELLCANRRPAQTKAICAGLAGWSGERDEALAVGGGTTGDCLVGSYGLLQAVNDRRKASAGQRAGHLPCRQASTNPADRASRANRDLAAVGQRNDLALRPGGEPQVRACSLERHERRWGEPDEHDVRAGRRISSRRG